MGWDFLTDDIPRQARTVGPGHGPGHRRHAGHHRGRPPLMAIPLGVLGAVYLNEFGGNGPLASSSASWPT